MGHYNSFLVRLCTEDGENLVRGYIQHAGTQEDTYFRDWDKMVSFMLSHLGWHVNHQLAEDMEQDYLVPKGDESID